MTANISHKTPGYPAVFFYGWLMILCLAPLPYASNTPWALATLVLLCSALVLAMVAYSFGSGISVLNKLQPFRWPVFLLGLVPLWSSIQLIPLPLHVLDTVSPQSAATWRLADFDQGALSLDTGSTRLYAAWSWALWLFFCMTLLLLDSGPRVQQAGMAIVYFGVFQALYGSFMTLSGLEYGFFHEKQAYRGVATGTFINRNHLAGYLEMCLAVGIGLLVASLSHRSHLNWRSRVRSLLDAMLGAKMRLRVFLALMVIALVLTRSRMGNTAFFASLMICGALWMLLQRRLHRGAIILFVSLVLIDTLIVGQWFGLEEVVKRLENTTAERESRDEVIRDTLVMLQDFPVTGTGLGSYENAFLKYQQADIRGLYDHAHNDYLEFAVELGLVGFIPLAILVLWSLGRALHAMYSRRDPLAKGTAFAASMAIIALMIHSAVDFNLQMPANALLFIVILALAWVAAVRKN